MDKTGIRGIIGRGVRRRTWRARLSRRSVSARSVPVSTVASMSRSRGLTGPTIIGGIHCRVSPIVMSTSTTKVGHRPGSAG